MPLKRLAVGIAAAFLVSTLGLATSAQAIKRFTVSGGGGQTHIGNGLMIPIQAAAGPGTTGTMFPNLRIPVNGVPIVTGTVTKPIQTAGTKMAYQRRLNVPAGVLRISPAKTTVGVKFSNPTVFAVQTNLQGQWPAAAAVFSTGNAVATTTIGPIFGGTMTYSNALGTRFGGAAQFAITSADPPTGPDLFPTAPVTVWIKINGTTPPCTHPAQGGGAAGCVAGAILAVPGPVGAIGAASTVTIMTPGVVIPGLNIAAMKMGAVPLGTLLASPILVAMGADSDQHGDQPGRSVDDRSGDHREPGCDGWCRDVHALGQRPADGWRWWDDPDGRRFGERTPGLGRQREPRLGPPGPLADVPGAVDVADGSRDHGRADAAGVRLHHAAEAVRLASS